MKISFVIKKIVYKMKKVVYTIDESRPLLHKGTRFTHVSTYACQNVGDTVLSKCVRQYFEQFFNVNSWLLIEPKQKINERMIKRINSTKALIIGGGGMFIPDTNYNNISGWEWPISVEMLNKIKVPIIVYSVGYNYFDGQTKTDLFKKSINELLNQASFFGLRNNGSIREIKAITNTELQNKIIYQPCLTTLINKIMKEKNYEREGRKRIGINIAFDRIDRRMKTNPEKILKSIAMAISKISRKGYRIVYMINCTGDERFLPYLKQEGIDVEVLDASFDYLDDCIKKYLSVEMMIGMRGHSQMIQFGLGGEILSLGSHDKIKWFLEDIDALDWYIDINDDSVNLSNTIFEKFVQIHEIEHEKTHIKLATSQEKLWSITQKNRDIITNTLQVNE